MPYTIQIVVFTKQMSTKVKLHYLRGACASKFSYRSQRTRGCSECSWFKRAVTRILYIGTLFYPTDYPVLPASPLQSSSNQFKVSNNSDIIIRANLHDLQNNVLGTSFRYKELRIGLTDSQYCNLISRKRRHKFPLSSSGLNFSLFHNPSYNKNLDSTLFDMDSGQSRHREFNNPTSFGNLRFSLTTNYESLIFMKLRLPTKIQLQLKGIFVVVLISVFPRFTER